ncbi:MAG: hypothetical protein N2327_05070 [Caldimicrobium sp.]|nr:hypothetical protein [Caldimicrobium sp.]MCX7873784.1 hypothetical protein [Caldimicrobium sp.]
MSSILGLLVAVLAIGLIVQAIVFAVFFYGAITYILYKILLSVLTLIIKGVKNLLYQISSRKKISK